MDNEVKRDESLLDNLLFGRVQPHIYAFKTNTIPNYLKIGDTYRPVNIRLDEWREVYPDLKKEFADSALINNEVFFRDYSVHQFLENDLHKERINPNDFQDVQYVSNEFFKETAVNDVELAIDDIKNSFEENLMKYKYYSIRDSLLLPDVYESTGYWNLRPNQKAVVEKFKVAISKGRNNLLMYAVMRFGKSFTAMSCANEMNAKIVLIVSGKADVQEEWKKTIQSADNFNEYVYLISSDLHNENIIDDVLNANKKVAIFLTLQDLQGDNIKERHKQLFKSDIDLLIVDETHFAARAEKYGEILRKKDIKDNREGSNELDVEQANNEIKKMISPKVTIHLSGTPYRILMGSEFEEEDIIAFVQFTDIVDEKEKWDKEHLFIDSFNEWDNPYYGFPQMIRFAFRPSEKARNKLEELKKNGISTAFSELLRPLSIKKSDEGLHKQFKYSSEVLELLETIDGSRYDDTVLGFLNNDKIKNGNMCRHIIIVLPFRASCDALEEMINTNSDRFLNLNDYEIINIAGVDQPDKYKKLIDIKNKIKNCEENGVKTITLTVNRGLTGTTVEEWDSMIYLKDTSSAQEYDQSIFRIQNQNVVEYENSEENDVIKYNKKPQTVLVDFDPNRMFIMQENKSMIYNVNIDSSGNNKLYNRIEKELKISPIITVNKDKISEITPMNIMEFVSDYSNKRGVFEEVYELPVDLSLIQIPEIMNVILKQGKLGSRQGMRLFDDGEDDLTTPDIIIEQDDDDEEENVEVIEGDNTNNQNDIKDDLVSRFRTYYARILFFAILTKSNVNSLEEVINVCEENDNNRIIENLGLDKMVLTLIYKNIDLFNLRQLDYKIQNMNRLSNDETVDELTRANTAINKFDKLSEVEIITPKRICDEMLNQLGDALKKIICDKGKILDIASKKAEFALAIVDYCNKNNIEKEKYINSIYSIPTSRVAYEFTRKIYEILGLKVDNILFNISLNELVENQEYDNFSFIYGGDEIKIDLVIGNPPYQENTSENSNQGTPIYQKFVNLSKSLSSRYVSLIIPSRWMTSQTVSSLVDFRNDFTSDNRIRCMTDYIKATDCFETINLSGGVCYFLYDKEYNGDCIFTSIFNNKIKTKERCLSDKDIIPHYIEYEDILEKVDYTNSLSDIVSPLSPFGIPTTERGKAEPFDNSLILHTSKGIRYFENESVKKGREFIGKYKVLLSQTVPGKAGEPDKNGQHPVFASTIKVIGPNEICTHSYILIGAFDTELEAKNLLAYLKTKFVRCLVYISISSIHLTQASFAYVPIQDFNEEWDDEKLYEKYNISKEEIEFINSIIKDI